MQHRIAAHETRVSGAVKRASASDRLQSLADNAEPARGARAVWLLAVCRSPPERHGALCPLRTETLLTCRLPSGGAAAVSACCCLRGSVIGASGPRVRQGVYCRGARGADFTLCGAAQELQLLTAKADLEAQVQRLRLQAERKGVHLETGEHSDSDTKHEW